MKSAVCVSSKSYWQMSRTPVINQTIFSAKSPRPWRGCGLQGWRKEQGWLGAKNLWCKAQGYTGKKWKTSSGADLVVPLNEGPAWWGGATVRSRCLLDQTRRPNWSSSSWW